MAACCVGHALLVTAGIGGFGTVLGALTGNGVLVVAAAVVTVAVSTVAWLRTRKHRPMSSNCHPDDLDAANTGTSTEATAEPTTGDADKRTQHLHGVPADPAAVGQTREGRHQGRPTTPG